MVMNQTQGVTCISLIQGIGTQYNLKDLGDNEQ